ncbi:unnamed protein product [Spodoptera littoralis]|uniref:Uncharacterized protein n=1 Tax=Spodoptera littoralis TaxID=7109 RepID=A0A9P0I3F3_SPOLI|nr:unnamed protein product [Spodoptera littoralis]CAH1640378.1 unnamed protein product [Spodoptera littoralis]
MKFLTVFALLVAAVAADYSHWSLHELSEAIQNPNTDPALLPALEDALNQMMDQIFAEKPVVPADANAPVDLTGWTLHDLVAAMENPETDPALMPYLEHALNEMMDAIYAGIPVEAVGVPPVSMEVSHWTLPELSEALQNPETDPAMIPYLEHALNQMMDALYAGHELESIAIVAPAGLAPAKPDIVNPVPMPMPVVEPAEPAPIETPVLPEPAPVPSSPLVQIIVNINQQ